MATASQPPSRARAWALRALFAIVGLALGGGLATAVLYDVTGRRATMKVLKMTGLARDAESLYGFGRERLIGVRTWPRVDSPNSPLWAVRPGLDVELVAEGLTNPVNLAFVESPAEGDDAILFYVNELHGKIKYVTRAGEIGVYAEELVNFDGIPTPKTDERGLTGMTTVPGSEDLIVTSAYQHQESGLLRNHVLRLYSEQGGRRMERSEVLLDTEEFTSPSHQIQQVLYGPDGKLYVSIGDGEVPSNATKLSKFAGKILRMNEDGSAPEDNPFYLESEPRAPRSYVFSYGVRNVFDFDFDPESGRLYAGDNGQNDDRLLELVRAGNYAWNGRIDATRLNALYTWGPVPKTAGPVGLVIARGDVLGPGTKGHLYMGACGAHVNGETNAKMIYEMEFDPETGLLTRPPDPIIQYVGKLQGTVIGLSEGPDGLYFTDIFGEVDDQSSRHDGTGRIWKVVTSDATKNLSPSDKQNLGELSSIERGQAYFAQYCLACHRIDGQGGSVGPDLSHIATELERVNTAAYDALLDDLMKSDKSFVKEQRPRLEAVRNAERGPKRKRLWLKHHIEEPRFDELHAKMPPFAHVPEEERNAMIDYLLSRK